jgi:sugar phosphate permease
LLGLSLGLVGVLPQTVLISRWFRRQRGLAMGIVLSGTSLGGTLISLVARPLIEDYGWRVAMFWLSLIVWLVLLPAILFLVKEKAGDLGLNFDGDWQNTANNLIEQETNSNSETGYTFAEALKTPAFWILSLCAAAVFYPIFTVYQQFILYIQSPQIGVDATVAGYAQSTIGLTAIAGKFFFGWLSDYLPTTKVMLICCFLMFLATLFLLGFLSAGTIFVFLIPFALGYGGTFVLLQLLAVESFGLRDIGKILGALTVIETFGGFVGSVVTGKLASAAGGDYTSAFYGVTLASGLALLMTFAIFLVNRKQTLDE